ncbi:MAG: ring-cleaving dioxygenase [Phycisphaerales bacterium]
MLGLHHVTAFAGDPRACRGFYTSVLGLRLVKVTVNFDDPSVHHLYFGDERGSPGTLLTHFPHPRALAGVHGTPAIGTTLLRVRDPLAWGERLAERGVSTRCEEVLGAERVRFEDPDGMRYALVGGGEGEGIGCVEGVEIRVTDAGAASSFLRGVLGFEDDGASGARTRLRVGGGAGSSVELVESAALEGNFGAGVVHHVAWRVADVDAQAEVVDRLRAARIATTEVKDRDYFKSVYARVPGGVIFEFATDGPGFDIDEPPESLGGRLCLPVMYEGRRAAIEAALPTL